MFSWCIDVCVGNDSLNIANNTIILSDQHDSPSQTLENVCAYGICKCSRKHSLSPGDFRYTHPALVQALVSDFISATNILAMCLLESNRSYSNMYAFFLCTRVIINLLECYLLIYVYV